MLSLCLRPTGGPARCVCISFLAAPEIGNHDLRLTAVEADAQEVARLDVAMEDVALVEVSKTSGRVREDRD